MRKGNYPVFINPVWLWALSRQYILGLHHWNHALINHWIILFKSLIANMAGFLLWLSITSIMIEVFKVALAQWILFYGWI
jgi:hypothetical protein